MVSPLTSTCGYIIQITFDDCFTSPSINTVSHFHQIQPHEMDPCAFFTPHQNTFSVIWDTGTTQSIGGYVTDFFDPFLYLLLLFALEELHLNLMWQELVLSNEFLYQRMGTASPSVYRHIMFQPASNDYFPLQDISLMTMVLIFLL